MDLPYNPNDKNSVIEYAKLLVGKTLRDIITPDKIEYDYKGKGNFGQLVEEYYFEYKPNSKPEPDFPEIGLELKTTPLKQLRNSEYRSKERLVLNIIDYKNVIHQQFKEILEHKFLFVFYQYENNQLLLRKVRFWNMSFADICEAEKVWVRTKEIVNNGNIVRSVIGKTRHTNFPNKSFSSVSHVRPHASNAEDTYPLPTRDKLTQATKYTKYCFWLNNTFVRDEIYYK